MPLEQIRPSIQLFQPRKNAVEKMAAGSEDYGADELAEARDMYEDTAYSPRRESMNLLKLGGVGGVTRSGSWNRNLSREHVTQTLTRSPEVDETNAIDFGEDVEEQKEDAEERRDSLGLTPSSNLKRASSIPHTDSKRRTAVAEHFRSGSSDVPSSSSRTSTSSYSAAAFSLRSVSNRNSVSSTSSSGASSLQSATAASDDESTATNSSSRVSQVILPPSSSTLTTTAASMNDSALGIHLHPSLDDELRESGEAAKTEASSATIVPVQSNVDLQKMVPEEAYRPSSLNLAPPQESGSLSPKSDCASLKASSPSLSSLTLSAAAASPASPTFDSSPYSQSRFIPAAPRRHTSTFALRSRSLLSQSGQPYGSFTGGGGGRAAAREMARNLQSSSYENAPFSELEARRDREYQIRLQKGATSAKSQPGSPIPHRRTALTPPAADYQIAAATPTPARKKGLSSSSQFSPRTPVPLPHSDGVLGSPRLGRRGLRPTSSSSDWSPRLASASAAEADFNRASSSYRPADVDTIIANASYISPSLTPASAAPSGFNVAPNSANSATGRPSLTSSQSTTNVLRTPTTEEWSRFLAKQGVDPAAVVAAANASGRPRTNTGRSSTSQMPRRFLPDRMTAFSSSTSNVSDLAVAAAAAAAVQQQEDSLSTSYGHSSNPRASRGNSLELKLQEEDRNEDETLTDNLRRLGLSRNSLLPGGLEDLSMLHEDYEGEQASASDEDESMSDERMQALHEAISRPPSRRGTPPPLDSPESPLDIELDLDSITNNSFLAEAAAARRRSKRPSREAAAAVLGYPLAPPGERRKIDDFVILSDIGRGAYGLVKRAQLKDPVTRQATGSEFVIKYIIKSRILADCWRRHKLLGPIPIEIHVMDQLRRLPYHAPSQLPPWSVEVLLDYPPAAQALSLSILADNVGHPSLCKMVDFFEDHEFYYMVMPCFGKGQDLFDFIEAQPHGLSSMQVRCIFGQVADGLHFLHQNNIVHRDIKDENVILDGDGHAQIIDFGSAAHIDKSGRLFDTFSGTLDYAAAEILKGEKYGGKEQDVWALGVVGYVLLCGDCPFWNGEEAMSGLQPGTRAAAVLQERCCVSAVAPEEHEQRLSDQAGQPDGGGRIEDAADLIQQCLELDVSMRPSMNLICRHRFLLGDKGWRGPLGWQETVEGLVDGQEEGDDVNAANLQGPPV